MFFLGESKLGRWAFDEKTQSTFHSSPPEHVIKQISKSKPQIYECCYMLRFFRFPSKIHLLPSLLRKKHTSHSKGWYVIPCCTPKLIHVPWELPIIPIVNQPVLGYSPWNPPWHPQPSSLGIMMRLRAKTPRRAVASPTGPCDRNHCQKWRVYKKERNNITPIDFP